MLCILRVLAAQNEVEEAVAIYVHGLEPRSSELPKT